MLKKYLIIILSILIFQNIRGQIKFKYGITGGLNVSTAILPDLKLNTSMNSILQGDDVVQGTPQLADYVALYKAGIFVRLDSKIINLRFDVVYDKTNILKKVDAIIFNVDALNINLAYLDFGMVLNLNIFKHFYLSAGYIPALLIEHQGNLDINELDQRVLSGFGFKFDNGITLDLNAIVGLSEVIDGSYIHNVMIPVTLSIPLN